MFQLKIFSRARNHLQPVLIQSLIFSKKENAVAEAMKCVPKNVELHWAKTSNDNDVAFYFYYYPNSVFKFTISDLKIDEPIINWSEPETDRLSEPIPVALQQNND